MTQVHLTVGTSRRIALQGLCSPRRPEQGSSKSHRAASTRHHVPWGTGWGSVWGAGGLAPTVEPGSWPERSPLAAM
jgi:hypothetical protein